MHTIITHSRPLRQVVFGKVRCRCWPARPLVGCVVLRAGVNRCVSCFLNEFGYKTSCNITGTSVKECIVGVWKGRYIDFHRKYSHTHVHINLLMFIFHIRKLRKARLSVCPSAFRSCIIFKADIATKSDIKNKLSLILGWRWNFRTVEIRASSLTTMHDDIDNDANELWRRLRAHIPSNFTRQANFIQIDWKMVCYYLE